MRDTRPEYPPEFDEADAVEELETLAKLARTVVDSGFGYERDRFLASLESVDALRAALYRLADLGVSDNAARRGEVEHLREKILEIDAAFENLGGFRGREMIRNAAADVRLAVAGERGAG